MEFTRCLSTHITGGDGGGDAANNNHSPRLRADASTDETDADGSGRDQNGFRPWEAFAFNYGLEALNIIRCLYLAAWLCTYAVPAFLEWFSVGWALLYVLVVPVPVRE